MEQTKYHPMQAILHKLEDIKNSQESIIDKINHIITDLFANPDNGLERGMEAAQQKASHNVEAITEVIENYEIKFNKMQLS